MSFKFFFFCEWKVMKIVCWCEENGLTFLDRNDKRKKKRVRCQMGPNSSLWYSNKEQES
jgi:hypothetical protein